MPLSRSSHWLMVTLVTLSSTIAGTVVAQEKMLLHGLPREVGGVAVDPATGHLCVTEPKNSTVSLLAISNDGIRVLASTKVAGDPMFAVYKRLGGKRWFVIGSRRNRYVYLLDVGTLRIAHRIPTNSAGINALVSSRRANDPFVYYAYSGGHDASLARIDLRSKRSGPNLSSRGSRFALVRISGDGRYVYRYGPFSPSGFDSYRLVEGPKGPQLEQAHDEHTSNGIYVPGPFGQYCAAGKEVYSADLNKRLAVLKWAPQAFMTTRPVMLGFHKKRLMAASTNSLEPVGDPVSLPRGMASATDHAWGRSAITNSLVADELRKRILIVSKDQLLSVPLALLGLPAEPLLQVQVEWPEPMIVGRELTAKVVPTHAGAKVTLGEKPKGMTLTGNLLRWTPQADQVGAQKLELRIRSGKYENRRAYDLRVSRSFIQLTFKPSGLALGPEGRYGVVWSGGVDSWGRSRSSGPQKMATIDFQTGKILGSATLMTPIRRAAIDARGVYLAHRDSDAVDRLDPKTFKRTARRMLRGTLQAMQPLGGDRLFVKHAAGTSLLAVPTLRVLRRGAGARDQWGRRRSGATVRRLGQAWLLDGRRLT